jgi:hypothetical protein
MRMSLDGKTGMNPNTVRVRSVGLAHIEEQEKTLKRFAHTFLGASSDSPKALDSEDENDSTVPPELGEDSAVQVVSGNGFQTDKDQEGTSSNDGREVQATGTGESDAGHDSKLDAGSGPTHDGY